MFFSRKFALGLTKKSSAVLPKATAILLIIMLLVPAMAFSAEPVSTGTNPSREEIAAKLERVAKEKDIPSAILKAIAYAESGWRQWDSKGKVVTGGSATNPSYGIMQVSLKSADPAKIEELKNDIDYNISAGADILNSKFQFVPKIGDGDRNKLENWYFVLWAYNNWSTYNNPNNAGAEGRVAYQDMIIKNAAKSYFPGLVTPVTITPIDPALIPKDTLPAKTTVWETPIPTHSGNLDSSTMRIAGLDRIDTVNQVALTGWPDGAETVLIARSDDFPDALAGVTLAKKYKAPILVTSPQNLENSVLNVLQELQPQKIIILGGEGAVSTKVENQIKENVPGTNDISRIAGKDRYETAALIAGQIDYSGEIAIATGSNFPDALTMASSAAAKDIPLILTQKDVLPAETLKFLKNAQYNKIYLAGGEGVISSDLKKQLRKETGLADHDIIRLGGSDRFETSAKTLEYFFPDTDVLYIADGLDFSSPLAAGALAASQQAPLLIVQRENNGDNAAAGSYIQNLTGMVDLKIIGNRQTITDKVVTLLQKKISES